MFVIISPFINYFCCFQKKGHCQFSSDRICSESFLISSTALPFLCFSIAVFPSPKSSQSHLRRPFQDVSHTFCKLQFYNAQYYNTHCCQYMTNKTYVTKKTRHKKDICHKKEICHKKYRQKMRGEERRGGERGVQQKIHRQLVIKKCTTVVMAL